MDSPDQPSNSDAAGAARSRRRRCAQPLVRAFGVGGAARASLAPYSEEADVDALLDGLADLV
jgi:selenocysteine lyase/cysteine desulfurase